MRRWKRAFDMGDLRRGRRASCPWRTTNCCCRQSTARRRCSALTMSLPARRCIHAEVNLPENIVAQRRFGCSILLASGAHRGKHQKQDLAQ
eukprot:6196657-Pleurochrysis_carterae.AAC.2